MGKVSPFGQFDMPFICHCDEAAYVPWLYAVFWEHWKKSADENGFDSLSLCCLEPPTDKIYVTQDAAGWLRELDSDRRQGMNAKECR